jgi:hypothetical protein
MTKGNDPVDGLTPTGGLKMAALAIADSYVFCRRYVCQFSESIYSCLLLPYFRFVCL